MAPGWRQRPCRLYVPWLLVSTSVACIPLLLTFGSAHVDARSMVRAGSKHRPRRRFLREHSSERHFALVDPHQHQTRLDADYPWALKHIPFLDFDDDGAGSAIVATYYFRWRVFKRHLRQRQREKDADPKKVLCCAGIASTCALVGAHGGWCAGAKTRKACHESRTETRPCVWSGGRCSKGFPHGSRQSPECPAPPMDHVQSTPPTEVASPAAPSHLPRSADSEWVVTEFEPDVPWAGAENTIACSAAHHLFEGRWLRNGSYMQSYLHFWFDPASAADPRAYTFWAATAALELYVVHEDSEWLRALLPRLVANYEAWRSTHWSASEGCFWQYADRDGQEHSIGGDGCRPLLNSAMFAEASSLAAMASILSDASSAERFQAEAERWRAAVLRLWDDARGFFMTRAAARPASVPRARWTERQQQQARDQNGGACPPSWTEGELVTSRELAGLSSPWYFGVVPPERADAYLPSWARLFLPEGFAARWGPRTAERADRCYNYATSHECSWNGPSWPFETSKVITAAMSVLRDYPDAARASDALDPTRVWKLLQQYALAHTATRARNASGWELPGAGRAWIGEALEPDEGTWLVRERLYATEHAQRNRGARYLHSTYCDLIMRFLGLRPLANGTLLVQPLLPVDSGVRYFAIDGVRMRERDVCVAFDRDGSRYGLGAGVHVLLEGVLVASGILGGRPLRVQLV